MLDVEAALARACARAGLVPEKAAEAIGVACRAEDFDLVALGRATADHATPVVGLVRALRAAVADDVAEHVHLGATSQDIVDTAAMLVARRALGPILAEGSATAAAAARLARTHRDTVIAGRTLLQQALPTSFGLKAAGWLTAVEEALQALRAIREGVLAVQMGGPVGHRDPALGALVAAELHLADPGLSWHTNRVRPATLSAALGVLAGTLAKVARDIVLLAQSEVAEVREGGEADRGASSAMAHKRNPVGAVSVLACTERVPGLVATMLSAMAQEHERAAGAWQAEWGTLSELLRLTGSAAAWSRELLEELVVDPARMCENTRGLEGDLGAAGLLIDQVLLTHERAPR
jgi:3-carboxy-cis,cis-muconate cycloisomerase